MLSLQNPYSVEGAVSERAFGPMLKALEDVEDDENLAAAENIILAQEVVLASGLLLATSACMIFNSINDGLKCV